MSVLMSWLCGACKLVAEAEAESSEISGVDAVVVENEGETRGFGVQTWGVVS